MAGPRFRRLVRVALLATLALAGLASTARGAAPALPAFGDITASATFGRSIDFTEPAVLPDGFVRVEIVVDSGDSTRSFVADVQGASAGQTTLRYSLATAIGSELPNTRVTGHFRVTLADRSLVDGPSATVLYSDTRFQWKTLEGNVVRVHWSDGGQSFGQRALRIGEDAIDKTTSLLGVKETEPIDFFVYADRQGFLDVLGPGSREWVGGVAFPEIRTLLANIDAGGIDDPWVGIVIPHELTHVVLHTATDNPYRGVPHWMDEGIAVYESAGYTSEDRGQVRRAVGDGTLMPLAALDGQFPTTADASSLAYAESASAIKFLVDRYGRDALVSLVRSYAGGVTDDEAFTRALGVDTDGFEAAWLSDLGATAPVAYGPRPAPAGPVPSGWNGAAPTPGVVAGPSGSPSGGPAANGRGGDAGMETIVAAIVGIGFLVGLVLILRSTGRRPAPREIAVGAAPANASEAIDRDDDGPP
jgi:hypothetical protein